MSEQFEQDDREVLLRAMAKRVHNREVGVFAGHDDFGTCVSCEESVTAILAAGFRRSPEPQQVAEYEYGLLHPESCTGEPHLYSTNREHIEREHRRGHPAIQIVRRVKAGPWVAIEKGGE